MQQHPLLSDEVLRKLRADRILRQQEKARSLRLWDEMREKVGQLPVLMDDAKQHAIDTGRIHDADIDASAVGDLLFEINYIKKQIELDICF